MARSAMFAWPPPETAEVYGDPKTGLKIETEDRPDSKRWIARFWRGRQSKPYKHHWYPSAEARDKAVQDEKDAHDAVVKFKAEQKAAAKQRKQEMADKIQVGTILHNGWGYEQTNCDYWQVVERSGMKVVVRKIAGEVVEGSEGYMSCRMRPVPDAFLTEGYRIGPETKMIGPSGISFDHGYCSIVENPETASHYCSWYA